MKPLEIGICSWSIDRSDPVRALEIAGSKYDLNVTQLGILDPHILEKCSTEALRTTAQREEIEISAICVGFQDEDYSSIESIRRTGGFGPQEMFQYRLEAIGRVASLATDLGVKNLVVHIGAIPTDQSNPQHDALLERVRNVADAVTASGVRLLIETGSEPADILAAFLDRLERDNIGVNFDPGNFLLYGTGDPVQAVRTLKGRIVQMHAKDALASSSPGIEWGMQRPLGAGDANMPRVISKLRAIGYGGPVLIECDIANDRTDRIQESIDFLRSMLV